jgi:hypothetical protein
MNQHLGGTIVEPLPEGRASQPFTIALIAGAASVIAQTYPAQPIGVMVGFWSRSARGYLRAAGWQAHGGLNAGNSPMLSMGEHGPKFRRLIDFTPQFIGF